ncbi:hypothetical protein Ssi02_20100 [Sinosporangium siamense]|uniref:Uncharacterized protein n=1 Tax=Sinosporangium siamense TaxID=1367973 RepID=A0A919RH73_9ACTN|nr:hypothetical protein Ssi02_20100 [Sinosporangium siamense]
MRRDFSYKQLSAQNPTTPVSHIHRLSAAAEDTILSPSTKTDTSDIFPGQSTDPP